MMKTADRQLRKSMLKWFLFVGTAISLYFVPWPILVAWLRPLPDSIQAQLEEGLGYGFAGVVAYVNAPEWGARSYAAGWHDRDAKIPANPQALFKIASIGKVYNAVTLTKLVHQGLLDLEGTLAGYLPKLRGRIEYADQITLRMLVRHRSGIPNYTDTDMYWAHPKASDAENLALVLDRPANFKPDQDYQYCNTNYLLLGSIMDRVLGYPNFRYLYAEVLAPHGFENTFDGIDSIDMDRLMSGYYVGYDQDLKDSRVGSMVASAEDVGRFFQALNAGTLLHAGEQAVYDSIYVRNHTGLIPGYQSIVRYNPETGTTLVLFTNTVDFEGYHWSLGEVLFFRLERIVSREGKRNAPL